MWGALLRELFMWPGRWLEAWVNAVANGSIPDIVIMAVVTVGSEFLSFIVDDEIGTRIVGEIPFVKVGLKSFFVGLGPVILFLTIPFTLFLPLDPLTKLVAILAWPATILWSLLVMPLYLVSGEILRTHEADTEVDHNDLALGSAILIIIAVAVWRYALLPGIWSHVIAGYLVISAVCYIPVTREKIRREIVPVLED